MGPGANIDNSSDLGSHDMDRNHDWINDAKQRYSNDDLASAETFMHQASSSNRIEENDNYCDIMDYQSLNEKQMTVFKRIELHYQNMLAEHQEEPLRIIIMGTAGTGKSYLIKAIKCRLNEMAGVESKTSILILAPTGEKLKDVKYIIIDEKSMIGCRILALVDMWLRQAFPKYKNEPFGSRSIVIFGDFGQLPPVLDLPMYTDVLRDPLSNNGHATYLLFQEVYKLDVVQRQSGNSKEQEEFRDILLRLHVKYIIIDEKSMIGCRILALVDMWLRQAFPKYKNEPFGSRSIVIFGDFGQLPPVLDLPMYTDVLRDPLSNNGHATYLLFQEVYKLDVVQRQSGNSKEQEEFRDILLRLRNGESTLPDWKILTTRFEEKLSGVESNQFSDAMFLSPKWSEVNVINIDNLGSLNVPVAKILAIHTGGSEAKRADSDIAHGLEVQLLLARGARIMLTANIWTEAELVNSSIGTIQDILFGDKGPPSLPIAVFINFENYKGPTITALEGTKVVPITPV
ncbi:hypothetical protein Glove_159g42 [Diversispora epigaea]|uniref:ATP-dependent DNA helicase n=1 Tax=Diversispora epigaea TaxID=1348612 RepID=A0A397IRG7_9GLOM|nr:hypothetical protein Glove_159g42 [Diversispora epigaea]